MSSPARTPRSDLIVVGGGLIGLAVAYEACRAGLSVTVLEAESCGRHASSASAGGVRSLNRHPAEIPLARAALPLWQELSARLSHDVGFVASGQVRVAEDEAAMAALEARRARSMALGWSHEEIVGRNALFARVPSIARHCLGALVVADDGFADPLATLHAYRAACLRAGVAIREGVRVRALARHDSGALAVETDAGTLRAAHVANCAGAWGSALARDPVRMRVAALQMIVTGPFAPFVEPVVGSEGRKLSLKQTSAGAVVIGGAFEGEVLPGPRGRVKAERVSANLANAVSLFPALADATVLRTWAGLEGMVADGLPILGESAAVPGLVHAYGFSAHGFALAPLVGEIVADLVCGRTPRVAIDSFSPSRFPAEDRENDYEEPRHARA